MESWRIVWRTGVAPSLSLNGLRALRDALAKDDPRLVQGNTTVPPPLMCSKDLPVEAACALGFCGWQGGDVEVAVIRATVGEVEEYFARACFETDQRCGEPASCRYFLDWFDGTARDVMINELLPEVDRAITERVEQG